MKQKPATTNLIRSIFLLMFAIATNIGLGYLVRDVLQLPLYLDSIGTILVGTLLGPLAGAATGAFSNILWSFIFNDPAILPFSITAAFIGWAAGYAGTLGVFDGKMRFGKVVVSGLLTGIGAALISAPIAAYALGGVTGSGMDYLTKYLTNTGANILQAMTIEGFISDPLDKMISFLCAWPLWQILTPYFHPLSRRGIRFFESLQGYSLAAAISLLSLFISFVFLPAFSRGIFHLFYLAVLLSALRGGIGPALFTTAVGVFANIFLLISPFYNSPITAEDWLRTGIFITISIAIAFIADQLEKNKRRLQITLEAEREGKARIRAIADGVNEALLLISNEKRVLNANQRFVEIFGIPLENIVGQQLEDIRTMYDQIFAEADRLFELTLTLSTQNKSVEILQDHTQLVVQNWPQFRELQLFSTPIGDSSGYLGRLFVFRDVTHEREVDRMKTEFVSLVSHELRTPLTSIKGFTEMVLEGDAGEINDEIQEYLGIVYNNAERLVSLVNDLLDISRIESGRVQLKIETVDLNEIVQTVISTMQPSIRAKDQSLSVEIDPQATRVSGDRDKLVQTLTNYVSNAHKYTQAGGELRLVVNKQDRFAHVAVSDNGHGISPEDQERLFTRFYRVDNSMTREVGGTGLGLSIVKQLVGLMGGEVGVQSSLAQGSTFFFTVPLAEEPSERSVPNESEGPAQNAGEGSVDSISESVIKETFKSGLPGKVADKAVILVIEDDPDIARLISRHLQKAGYLVRTTHSAEDALLELEHAIPDLITLDIELPGLQGDQLAQKLHANPRTRDIPILVLSVFAEDMKNINPEQLQFGAYLLPKPIEQEELLAKVAQMLQEKQAKPLLVVDDDEDVRRLLSTALEKRGFIVETAPDGEQGLVQARLHHPELILLDMHMPGMDGFSVLQALKNTAETADVPVIAMTGSPELKTNARARFLSLGAADFITKPFDMDRLVKEINIFISTKEL